MTVQALCDALITRRLAELKAVEEGVGSIPAETFDEALTPEWLADNIEQIFDITQAPDSREDALTGALEINAFLASFQRAVEVYRTPRVNRWANRFAYKKRQLSESTRDANGKIIAVGGALQEQLRSLGVKVDDEFIIHLHAPVQFDVPLDDGIEEELPA
jgi:hypothetical protein